jgi:hypothetical protein
VLEVSLLPGAEAAEKQTLGSSWSVPRAPRVQEQPTWDPFFYFTSFSTWGLRHAALLQHQAAKEHIASHRGKVFDSVLQMPSLDTLLCAD